MTEYTVNVTLRRIILSTILRSRKGLRCTVSIGGITIGEFPIQTALTSYDVDPPVTISGVTLVRQKIRQGQVFHVKFSFSLRKGLETLKDFYQSYYQLPVIERVGTTQLIPVKDQLNNEVMRLYCSFGLANKTEQDKINIIEGEKRKKMEAKMKVRREHEDQKREIIGVKPGDYGYKLFFQEITFPKLSYGSPLKEYKKVSNECWKRCTLWINKFKDFIEPVNVTSPRSAQNSGLNAISPNGYYIVECSVFFKRK